MKAVNWEAIKTEYITSDISFRKLGKKYGLSHNTIITRAKAEGWEADREATLTRIDQQVSKNLVEEVVEKRVNESARIILVADALMDGIIDSLSNLDMSSKYAANSLKSLTSALKDLRDIKNLNRTELDLEEQKARIANLRKQAEVEETHNEITVSFEGVDEAWLK